MRKTFVLTLVAISMLALGTAAYAVGWTETFDSYADQAAFEAAWSPLSGTYGQVVIDTAQAKSGTQSAYQSTLAKGSWKAIGADIPTASLYFSTWFYDTVGTGNTGRTFASVQARAGAVYTGALSQLLAIGNYNTATTTKYYARIALGGINWFTLDGGPNRSVGWHFAEIVGKSDGTVDFKIDGILGGNKPVANVNFNLVTVGSGLAGNSGMYFDDVTVGTVPEPSSMLALASGLIGMAGFVVRRRK